MQINKKKLLGSAEYAFSVASLLHYSGGPLTLVLSGGAQEGDIEQGSETTNNSLIIVLFFLIYLITFFLLVVRWKKTAYVLSKDRFIWVLLGLVVFSILWSANPPKTISRAIALIGTSLFGIYLATRYTMKEQLKLLAWMFGIALVLSIVFVVVLPKYGIMGGIHAGKWRGIYNHKNVLGKLMAISTPIFLLLALDAKKNQLFLWLGCSFSLLLLLLSSATSSMINCVVILSLVPICQLLRLNYERMIPALTGILAIGLSLYTWVTSNAEALLGSLGKDTTLTGRGDLWPLVLNVIWKRPWLGYGYGGFWYGWDSEASALWYAATWTPPNSHNGFLDIWLQLGFVGLFLLAMIFTTSFIKALVCILFTKASITIWPLLYMTYMIMANLGETTLMVQNDIFWVIYVAVYYSLLFYSQDFTKMDKA